MDNFIVWVTAALSGWLVTWKKKCTVLKKKRMDGRVIQCMNVQRSRPLLINELVINVYSK